MDVVKVSKYMSLVLRHKPEAAGITLDANGWVRVDELIAGMNKSRKWQVTLAEVYEVVKSNDKQRFIFNEDLTKIRANQGHSIKVDVELKETLPPDILYHGTADKFVAPITRGGLTSQSRLHVHLTADLDTAIKVGKRHGKLVIFVVAAAEMVKAGSKFYLSENGVWLTEVVPARYLTLK